MSIQVVRRNGTSFKVARSAPRRPRARGKAVAKLSAPMTRAIKSVLKKEADTKFVAESLQRPDGFTTLNNYTAFSSGITSSNEVYACIPQLAQGSGESQRVGSHVSPTKCVIDLNIVASDSYNMAAVDKTIHVFVLSAKSVRSLPNFSAIPITSLLNIGNGSSGPFNGTSQAQTLPINTEEFTIHHHKSFRMSKGFGLAYTLIANDSCYAPSSTFRRLRLNVPLPKKLMYGSDADQYPTNAAPFLVIGWTSNDATGDTAPVTSDTYVEGRVQMYYKDV